MKNLVILSFLCIASLTAFGQMTKAVYEEGIKQETHKLNRSFKQGEISHAQYLYCIDTLQIERTLAYHMDIRYSTAEMLDNMAYAQQSYDRLLNKYYQLLLAKVEDQDQEVVKQAQRQWIAYRDATYSLNRLLVQDKYSGGGTIQSLLLSGRALDIVRQRVDEIAHYYLSGTK